MNTLHRKLWEALSYEEFREFCRVPAWCKKIYCLELDYQLINASDIIYDIHWLDTPQGFTYWSDIYERLVNDRK